MIHMNLLVSSFYQVIVHLFDCDAGFILGQSDNLEFPAKMLV